MLIFKGKPSKLTIINIVVAIVILALAASVVILAIRLRNSELDNYTAEMQEYYDNKCQSFATQNANSARGQIVFVGDSITDLYILDDHYSDLPLACYNRGIGGDTTAGVLKRLDVSVLDLEPSIVVLMIGTNDINGGLSEKGILERYSRIIEKIRSALPDARLYCMSITPENAEIEKYTAIKLADTTAKILRINPELRRIAEEKGATYLDLFSLLADENGHLIREYSDDGLHLNYNGLSVWTELLKPYFLNEK